MKNQIFTIVALVMFSQAGQAAVKYRSCYKDDAYSSTCSEYNSSAFEAEEQAWNKCLRNYGWWSCKFLTSWNLEMREIEDQKKEQVTTQVVYAFSQPVPQMKPAPQVAFLLGTNAQLTYAGIKHANGSLVLGEDLRNYGTDQTGARQGVVESAVLATMKANTAFNAALLDLQVSEHDLEKEERSKFKVTLKLGASELGEEVRFETYDSLYVDELKASLTKGTPVICWINKARIETIIKEDESAEDQIRVDSVSCLP